MHNGSDDYISANYRIVNLLKYTIELAVQKELSHNNVDVLVYELPELLKFKIRSDIYGENIGNREIRIPLTWWQHFKLTVFPTWVLAYFPVKYKVYDIDVKCLYPNFQSVESSYKYAYKIEEWII